MGTGVYIKFNKPGYPSVVAVNTGSGMLTKAGGVGSGTGMSIGEEAITINYHQQKIVNLH